MSRIKLCVCKVQYCVTIFLLFLITQINAMNCEELKNEIIICKSSKVPSLVDHYDYNSYENFVDVIQKITTTNHTIDSIELKHINEIKVSPKIKDSLLNDFWGTSFYISIKEDNILLASGNEAGGYINAMNYCLKKLGIFIFNFSNQFIELPNEIILEKISSIKSPVIHNLSVGNTGGFKDQERRYAFKRFAYANGWVGLINTTQHAFTSFYKDNKREIDNHPNILLDYYSSKNQSKPGRRVTPNLKDEKTMPLIYDWVSRKIEDGHKFISTAPADGIGNGKSKKGLPSGNKFVNNEAEKNFWITKSVGEYVHKMYPESRIMVADLAYGDGILSAKAPSFSFPDNVLIQLAPDAFQSAYDSPRDMYNDWSKKVKHLGYRAYAAPTIWGGFRPEIRFNGKHGIKTLGESVKNDLSDIEMFTLETNGYGYHVAPHLWVLGQFLSDFDRDYKSIETLYDEYFEKCYKESSKPIKEMFFNWMKDYNGFSEVPVSLSYLAKALNLTEDPIIKDRIYQLSIGVNYLIKKNEVAQETNSWFKEKEYIDFIKWAKEMKNTFMLQTNSATSLPYGSPKPNEVDWVPWKKFLVDKSWEEIKPQVVIDFEKNLSDYPEKFTHSKFSPDLSKAEPKKSWKRKTHPINFGELFELEFHVKEAGFYNFSIIPDSNSVFKIVKKLNQKDTIIHLNGEQFYSNEQYIRLDSNTAYKLAYKNLKEIILPSNLVFHIKKNYGHGRQHMNYFYVPDNVQEIILHTTYKLNQNTGLYYYDRHLSKFVQATNHYEEIYPHTYRVNIPVKGKSNIWLAKIYLPWKILNFDTLISGVEFNYNTFN